MPKPDDPKFNDPKSGDPRSGDPRSGDPKPDDLKSAGESGGRGNHGAQASASGAQSSSQTGAQSSPSSAGAKAGDDAISLLREEHRQVEQLFERFRAAGAREKETIVRKLCRALTQHMMLEEELFYPACEASNGDGVDESQVQHDAAKLLVAELYASDGGDPYLDAKVKVLGEQIRHHIQEEEQPQVGVFAKAQKAGVVTPDLGRELRERKQELEAMTELRPLQPVSLCIVKIARSPRQESTPMNQRYGTPPRDEYGRFASEYDDDAARGEGRRRGYGAYSGGGSRGYGAEEENGGGRYGRMSPSGGGYRGSSYGGYGDGRERRGGYGYEGREPRYGGYPGGGYGQGGYQGGYQGAYPGGYSQGRFSSRYAGDHAGEGYGGGRGYRSSGYGGRDEDEDDYRGRDYASRERESRGYGRGYEDEDEDRGYMRR